MTDGAVPEATSEVWSPRPSSGSTPVEVSVDLTTELRWFFDGPLPDEVYSWFTRDGARGFPEARCDAYRVDDLVDTGVKRRFRTLLELKLRQGPPVLFFAGRGLEGWLERWQRWSPADDHVSLRENTSWVDVEKTVTKRRFGRFGQERSVAAENRAMTGLGCDVEIAGLSIWGRPGWTFALAAFGPLESHCSSLDLAWESMVKGGPLPPQLRLNGANSCGYPEWIDNARVGLCPYTGSRTPKRFVRQLAVHQSGRVR